MGNAPGKNSKDRVHIVYKSKAQNSGENEIELPFKLLIVGAFTQSEDSVALDDRRSIAVTKENFDAIVEGLNVKIDLSIDNQLDPQSDQSLTMSLKLSSMDDFEPDRLVNKVEPLKELVKLRQSLINLKKLVKARGEVLVEAFDQILVDPKKKKVVLEEVITRLEHIKEKTKVIGG
ncbi:MAG: type VI secretion system contractile sheath small subunit [Deltaproteobacteria bacterium]|jgi:type VI secretion system protein ImpB|nr:type VI secretion system contractile sheath small subunit [Deltaproteobacteria bacterium]